jgi:membrane-associated phospholipid phosphatase
MKQLDHRVSRAVHGMRLGALDYALALPGMLFGSYVMPFFILALGIWVGWKFAAVATMSALTTLAITNPMKHWINRPRPDPLDQPRALTLRKLVNNPAFPSGDSAQAGNLTLLLILLGPLDWPASAMFIALIPACMFSRVYFGAHWWGDTVAGVLIGVVVALVYAQWFGAFVAG